MQVHLCLMIHLNNNETRKPALNMEWIMREITVDEREPYKNRLRRK